LISDDFSALDLTLEYFALVDLRFDDLAPDVLAPDDFIAGGS
jgi:hypothetical protein